MSQEFVAQPGKYLTLQLSDELYGFNIEVVREINQITNITPVPNTPEHLKGVINLRGKIIPVVDLRSKFKMDKREYDKETCIIVIENSDKQFGVIVDKVRDVLDFTEKEIELSPDLGHSQEEKYIKGVGKKEEKIIILVDVFAALNEDEIKNATANAGDVPESEAA